MKKDTQFGRLEDKALAAYAKVVEDTGLEGKALALFNKYYGIQVGAAKQRIELKDHRLRRPLNNSIGTEMQTFKNDLQKEDSDVKAKVSSAIRQWESEVNPSVIGTALKGFYNKDDKNFDIAGFQVDGIAGGLTLGLGMSQIADYLGLGTAWKWILGAAGAVVGALFTNKFMDHVMNKQPEEPSVPTGLKGPPLKQFHIEQPRAEGNRFAPPNIHQGTDIGGTLYTGVPNPHNRYFPNVPENNPRRAFSWHIPTPVLHPFSPGVVEHPYSPYNVAEPPQYLNNPRYNPLGLQLPVTNAPNGASGPGNTPVVIANRGLGKNQD